MFKREKAVPLTDTHTSTHTNTYTHLYIYIYIYKKQTDIRDTWNWFDCGILLIFKNDINQGKVKCSSLIRKTKEVSDEGNGMKIKEYEKEERWPFSYGSLYVTLVALHHGSLSCVGEHMLVIETMY